MTSHCYVSCIADITTASCLKFEIVSGILGNERHAFRLFKETSCFAFQISCGISQWWTETIFLPVMSWLSSFKGERISWAVNCVSDIILNLPPATRTARIIDISLNEESTYIEISRLIFFTESVHHAVAVRSMHGNNLIGNPLIWLMESRN